MTTETMTTTTTWTPPWGSALPPPLRLVADEAEDESTPTAATTTATSTTIHDHDTMMMKPQCPICLEEAEEMMCWCTTSCEHRVCSSCQTSWLKERRPRCPTCPICATPINKEDTGMILHALLGLDIEQEEEEKKEEIITEQAAGVEDEDDPQTTGWLTEQHAKQCPNCNVWIIKRGGCEHMTCGMCEFEFCWFCLCDYDECETDHAEDFVNNAEWDASSSDDDSEEEDDEE